MNYVIEAGLRLKLSALRSEVDELREALEGVLPFLTGEYWPGVVADAAVDRAIYAVRKVGADTTAMKTTNV